MTKRTGIEISNILVPIAYGIMAVVVAMLICWSGQYPVGSETMNHIYWGDMVYDSIKGGDFVALYDYSWYNGIEFFRNIAPLPTYFIALCQWLAGGDAADGYLMFIGLVFFISAMSWFYLGKRRGRTAVGTFIGVLWFFMPHNLFTLFVQGDLACGMCIVIFPFLVSGVYDYLADSKWTHLIKIMVSMITMAMCDLSYMTMMAIGIILFMLIYAIMYGQWAKMMHVILSMALAVTVLGVWLIGAWPGNNGFNVEIMSRYFQDLSKTINPLERYNSGNGSFYFGLSVLVLSVFGLVCSKNKKAPGFLTAILIMISTSASMYHVLKIIPGKSYLMMSQYITLALCIVLYMFLTWDTLKKPVAIVLCALLAIDVIPSLELVYGTLNGVPLEERLDETDQTTLIAKAKEVSEQRIVFLDGNELEAMGTYLVSGYGDGKAASMGGELSYAATISNITQLNRALTGGFYTYLFDRCIELGNDTVLIKMSQLGSEMIPGEVIDEAAATIGYELVDSNEFYRLYDIDFDGNWGVVSDYQAIGIGSDAYILSLGFPSVKEGGSNNLNDYTFKELSKYQTIYLSGFTYDDKEAAEKLVVRLSKAGVRVVIMADGIPEDSSSSARDFLGVVCNDISFSNGYPLLDTKLGILDCDFFPQGDSEWNTVYVNGLDEVWGTVQENELKLDFYGTVKNENIFVIGLNIVYYYSVTEDESVGKLLSDITKLTTELVPDRELVPLQVEYSGDTMTITSKDNNVNTTLAYHQMFNSEKELEANNNLLYVDAGKTVIEMKYPYFMPGLLLSLAGIAGSVFYLYYMRKRYVKENKVPNNSEQTS